MEKKFTHLHVHTEYSLLNGVGKIENIISKAKEMNMDSIAITDKSVMYGCVEFYKAAKKAGIKPIIGCEIDIKDETENEQYRLVLLVKDNIGYFNLMKIILHSNTNSQVINSGYLSTHNEGLIIIFSCYQNISKQLQFTNIVHVKKMLSFLKSIFQEDLYLEIQNHGIESERKKNILVSNLAKETDIPLVATNNVHYVNESDVDAFDILLCMQQGTTIDKVDKKNYVNNQYYLKSQEEMWQRFQSIIVAIENTQVIASKCDFDYEFHISKIPKYPIEKNIVSSSDYLQQLCVEGLNRYLNTWNAEKINENSSTYFERIQYELSVINNMGYVDYFLIVRDFMNFAKQNKIVTGPGRGSAAGSLVAFVLEITKIDPIKYGLVFERFLNPERISMPDIDCDFCYRRRQEVIEYVISKYGRENVAQIITFGTFASKTCIRDVGRAINMPVAKIEHINKLIPVVQGNVVTMDEALAMEPQLKKMYTTESDVKVLFELCRKIEGNPRHISTHAAGVVIAAVPLVNIIPMQENDGTLLTQFGMTTLEELGLLKIDFLGLKTLTVLDDAVKMIERNHATTIDFDGIVYNDRSVYQMLGKGETIGVFQLESAGMSSFIKELKPDCLEDIIAGISLYRPGPIAEIPKYIANKKNQEVIQYLAPQLKPILEGTYGCLIYQEQVMEIVRNLGGYSMGRSDLVRRAMSKKKHSVMEVERKTFIYGKIEKGDIIVPGCVRNGITEEVAGKIFDIMMEFASYAFNKSHAVAYAVLAYQTAYLVKYYPVEYMTAKLNSIIDNSEKVIFYIENAKKMNIIIKGPDINESMNVARGDNDSIRLGLEMIKNVGRNAAQNIVDAREKTGKFNSFIDFMGRVDLRTVNKKAIERLIKSGAFDSFGIYRSKLLSVYKQVYYNIISEINDVLDGQISLFNNNENNMVKYPKIEEFEYLQLLSIEKETLGLYISGHPLDEYIGSFPEEMSNIARIFNESNNRKTDNNIITIGGIITHVVEIKTKNKKNMLFLTLEDMTESIEVIVFPNILDKFGSTIEDKKVVIIEGKISQEDDEKPKIICNKISVLQKSINNKLFIRINNIEEIPGIKAFFKSTLKECIGGSVPIYIYTKSEHQTYLLNEEWWLFLDKEIIYILNTYFGEDNVKITDSST